MRQAELVLAVAFVTLCMPLRAQADEWGPIEKTESLSPNRTHTLKIKPHRNWPKKPGHCRATLFRGEQQVWSRHLINDHAPVRVFVADSGEYVLTMDEWHSVGELPVVIYGGRGNLIRVHSTDSLGLADDILHISATVSSYWWNEDAICFFGPEENTFFIRLHWGKWIVLDLASGEVLREEETFYNDDLQREHQKKWRKLVKYREDTCAEQAVRMLGSSEAEDRKTGALVCGQERRTEAIPALRKLLDDKAQLSESVGAGWTRVYFVRKAAVEALRVMGQDVEGVITEEPEEPKGSEKPKEPKEP